MLMQKWNINVLSSIFILNNISEYKAESLFSPSSALKIFLEHIILETTDLKSNSSKSHLINGHTDDER